MKHLMLSLIVVVITFSFVNAQTRVGVKAGALGTTLRTSHRNLDSGAQPNDVAKNQLGFSFGAFSQFVIKDRFVIQPEIALHRKKVDLYNGFFHSAFFSYNLLLGYRPFEKWKGLTVLAGPEIGMLLDGTLRQDQNIKGKSELNEFDAAINLGLDYQFKNGVGVGFRYLHGLSNYFVNLAPFPNGRYQTRSFQLYASYSFIK